jgi:hypothetical protein
MRRERDLGFLFLELLARFTLLDDPLIDLVHTLTWTGLVLQEVALKPGNLSRTNSELIG